MSEDLSAWPGVSAFTDRHGKRRYRYRRKGVTRALPGSPGHERFEAAYLAAIEGRTTQAEIVPDPKAAPPRSLGTAWRGVKSTAEWRALDPMTRRQYSSLAARFLSEPVAEGHDQTWKLMPVADLKRRHVKLILNRHADTPHRAKHILRQLRKMIEVALDHEWIEHDPTYKVRWTPPTKGHRAWTYDELLRFAEHWEYGTLPRTVFSLALWLGLRVSNIARLRWSDFDWQNGIVYVPVAKGSRGRSTDASLLDLPITPALNQALSAIERRGDYVTMTRYDKPISHKSITNKMQRWTAAAGLEPGCTTHGLRKTLGKWIAEAGGSTREAMEMLGHRSIIEAENYSRAAEQRRLAASAMIKVVSMKKGVG